MTKFRRLLHSIVQSILCQLVEGLQQILAFCCTAGLPSFWQLIYQQSLQKTDDKVRKALALNIAEDTVSTGGRITTNIKPPDWKLLDTSKTWGR